MSKIAAYDLAYVRFSAPDIDLSRRFLEAFGLETVEQTASAIYSRCTDAGPRCHILEVGEPGFLGSGFLVKSAEMLEEAATLEGASAVEPTGEPGGGYRVRLRDPEGYIVDLLHGVEILPELSIDPHPVNTARGRERKDGDFYRRPPGPARVKRLGHFVTSTTDVLRTRSWYRETLGLLGSDDIHVDDDKENIIATFNRLERGGEYVDHHVFMTHKSPETGFNHVGFEAQDADDMFFGGAALTEQGFKHHWGPGRHLLGSQMFNQWESPWGLIYEHWTDSDVMNEDSPFGLVPASEALTPQWGTKNKVEIND